MKKRAKPKEKANKQPDYDSLQLYSVSCRRFVAGFFTDGITVIECAPILFHVARNVRWDANAFVTELISSGHEVEPVSRG